MAVADEKPVLIVTLTAERGKKFDENGDAIASYVPPGKKFGSIVFLPRGCEPGKQYRVKLDDMGLRRDKAGREMYRAVPAPSTFSERWADNGDGTLSLTTFALNWKGEERAEGVRETRPKDARSRCVSTRTDPRLHLGLNQASSFVEDTPVEVWWDEEEAVRDGQIFWNRTAEREVAKGGQRFELEAVAQGGTDSEWWQHHLEPVWRATWSVRLEATYRRLDGAVAKTAVPAESLAALPRWCRKELEGEYPLCSCKRQRLDKATKTTCVRCEAEAEQVRQVTEWLPAKRRRELVAEVAQLLAGATLAAADGEALLTTLAENDARREFVSAEYTGYAWYYQTDDSVFGSKFSPEALELLTQLTEARGAGLVRLAAWVASGDYFLRTQVQGEVVQPMLQSHELQAATVATRLVDLGAIREANRLAVERRSRTVEKPRRNKTVKQPSQAPPPPSPPPPFAGTLAEKLALLNSKWRVS